MKQTLFTMLGYPGSGKSHFAKQLAAEISAVRLNSDSMRNSIFKNPEEHHNSDGNFMVFGAIDYAVSEVLKSGNSVVYDANCNRIRERQKNAGLALVYDAQSIVIWMKTPIEEAVNRVSDREVTLDQTRLSEETVQKHVRILENPTEAERVIVIDGTIDFSAQLNQFYEQLEVLESNARLEPKQNAKKITEVNLYTDGGSRGNPGPSASGFVLLDMDGNVVEKGGEYLGITTNNQAEYQAVKLGLETAKKLGARKVHGHMDSLLVVNQMNGIFKIKNRELWPIHQAITDLRSSFEKVTFMHVPREMNKLADEQVNFILDAEQAKNRSA